MKFKFVKLDLYGNSSFKNLSFIKNSTINLKAIFSNNLSSWNSKYKVNSSFTNSSFKSGKFLYIFKIVVDCQIFWPPMIFGHFGHILVESPSFLAAYQIFTHWLESENFLLRFIDKLFRICFLIGPNSLAQMNPSSTIIHSTL